MLSQNIHYRVLSLMAVLGAVAAQIMTGSSDRTQQELNLLGYTAGVRVAYCQQAPINELVEPFKEAVARMVNRFCRNPAACGLKKTVSFTKHQVVVMDTFPRRENRALNLRFFVVLPHEAVPMARRPVDKPLLSSQLLSEILQTQLSELTHGLGWQILAYERYPRFDKITQFMNRALIPILVVVFLCMLFLAYWSSKITSGSALYSGEGWMVSGSSGGKNAALRRTLEIIQEQKARFAYYDAVMRSQRGDATALQRPEKTHHRVAHKEEAVKEAPRSLASAYYGPARMVGRQHASPLRERTAMQKIPQQMPAMPDQSIPPSILKSKEPGPIALATPRSSKSSASTRITTTSTSSMSQGLPPADIRAAAEALEGMPEIVVVPPQQLSTTTSSGADTPDTMVRTAGDVGGGMGSPGPSRKTSVQSPPMGHRHRRMSVADEFKRKKPAPFGQADRQKRWQAGSLALGRFSRL